jgi:hypothetical protein
MRELLIRHTPTCAKVTALVSASLDHSLPLYKRLVVRLHFLICVWCRRYLTQVRFLRNVVREHPEELESAESAPSATLSPEARRRIGQALRDHRQ